MVHDDPDVGAVLTEYLKGRGFHTAQEQLNALLPSACVVMVSANQDVDVAQQTLAIGAADYIPKPVDFGYLDSGLEIHSLTGPDGR